MNGFKDVVSNWVKQCEKLLQVEYPTHTLSIMEGDRW
jgi:hypothetical protein